MKGINLNKSISFQTNKKNLNLIDNESLKYLEEKEQNCICVVSSKDRNSILYEFPSKYSISFLSSYLNVISLELIESVIPDNIYNVSNNCNFLRISNSINNKIDGFKIGETKKQLSVEYIEKCEPCGYKTNEKLKKFENQCKSLEFVDLSESDYMDFKIQKGFYDRDIILPIKITTYYDPKNSEEKCIFYKYWDYLSYSIQQEFFNTNDLNARDPSKPVVLVFFDIKTKQYEFYSFINKESFYDDNKIDKNGFFDMFIQDDSNKTKLKPFLLMNECLKDLSLTIKLGCSNNMFRLYFSNGLKPYGEQSIEKVPCFYPDGTLKRKIHKEYRDGVLVEVQGDVIYEEKKIGENDYEYINNSIGPVIGFSKKNLYGALEIKYPPSGNSITLLNDKHSLKVNDFIQLAELDSADWNIKEEIYIITSIDNENNSIEIIPEITNSEASKCRYIQKCTYHSDNTSNLDYNKSIILNIDNIESLQSNNNYFNKSYNIYSGEKSIPSIIRSENHGITSSVYSFNPPIVMFNKLNINFTDINGNLYDFGGLDNTLVFSIGKLNSIKYLNSNIHL